VVGETRLELRQRLIAAGYRPAHRPGLDVECIELVQFRRASEAAIPGRQYGVAINFDVQPSD
jgi:hypothetical protein